MEETAGRSEVFHVEQNRVREDSVARFPGFGYDPSFPETVSHPMGHGGCHVQGSYAAARQGP